MTFIPIFYDSSGGPTGPMPVWVMFVLGAFFLLVGVMLFAMLWDTRDILDTTASKVVGWCLNILTGSLALVGLIFIVMGLLALL